MNRGHTLRGNSLRGWQPKTENDARTYRRRVEEVTYENMDVTGDIDLEQLGKDMVNTAETVPATIPSTPVGPWGVRKHAELRTAERRIQGTWGEVYKERRSELRKERRKYRARQMEARVTHKRNKKCAVVTQLECKEGLTEERKKWEE